MRLNYIDDETELEISSDLLDDRLIINMEDDDSRNYCGLFMSREDSIEMANKILEFWNNNPKLNF